MTEQIRHKAFHPLARPRELVVVCPAFKSHVNLSRLVRLAGCAGVTRILTTGNGKVDPTIARDAADFVTIETRRSLLPVVKKLKEQGFRLVGLEQTDRSTSLYGYSFQRKTALVIGHERNGIEDEILRLLDDCVEIPVYGPPPSLNVVTATTMAIYEYCKQLPEG
jgi:tRNA G18 (ribose-2'-O)-methylase SpoU